MLLNTVNISILNVYFYCARDKYWDEEEFEKGL